MIEITSREIEKIYISGPMSNVEPLKRINNFLKAEAELKDAFPNAKIINPIYLNGFGDNLDYEDYMEVDLFMLNKCNAIYMLKGWEQSPGANRENGFAVAKNMIVLFER